MKLEKKYLILLSLLFMIILGFNSASAADSSDVVDESSADLSLSSSSDLEMIDDSESSSEMISYESLSEPNFIDEVSDSSSSNDDSIREGSDAIYLSKDGNDENDGSQENPVNTIERAIQLAVSENGPHKISVGEGSFVVFGIDLDDTYLTIEGSGIDQTTFDGVGYTGGIFSIYNSNLTIKNLKIIDGVNTGSSGGAFTNMGNLTIENLDVSGCIVKNGNGGVIYSVGNLNIANSSFTNNQVIPTDSGGNGGVIYCDGYYTSLSYPPSLNISGCEFINNTAKGNTFGGGAIYMQYVDGFKSIENTVFIGNKALSGGAIFMQNSEGNFPMNNVSFIKNVATGNVSNYGGGAINLIGKTDGRVGNVIIKNSQFVNNSAINIRGGGAILDRNVDLNISNSFIFNNKDTEKGMSIYKDTTVYYPNGGRIYLEDNWWGTNNPQKLDKITINRWVVADLSVELLDNLDSDLINDYNIVDFDKKLNYYEIKALLNSYNDGTLIENENYYPFDREFNIASSNGELNQSNGLLENNIASALLTSSTKENLITLRIDNQSLEFNTNSIISNISAEKLQRIIDNAEDGDTIDLSNCNCENISNVIINKNLTIIGNNATAIKSAGGNPIFVVDKNSFDVDSFKISNIRFLVDNGDTIVLVNARNSTNPLEIEIPAINISGITVEKINDNVVGESVNLLMVNSERGILATTNSINIENVSSFDGLKQFKFNVTSIGGESGINIPQGGNIDINGSSGGPTVMVATTIVAKAMKTTTVNTKINGKKAGKNYSITLKDSKGNVLAGKQVLISFNGKIYKRTTNAKGVASVKIALAKKGTYPVVVSFLGDEKYNGSFAVAKVKVNPQKVKLTIPKKTYKRSKKTKYLYATLKATNKKAIKGKKLTFTVNGKKYTAKTNAKGIAKVKVKLSKRKTYKFTVKFAGDNTFKKISKKGKVVIK
ncbi:hypothetical protein [Methanobrevibacter ruminantium]|uniref:hypothetical protein n=1 Tax=Methanobrevibacter ruminantium TaxID=83816 RepID=UPI0026EED131|nr:hypothetical protein [Methanobrevibacter ruminantium]